METDAKPITPGELPTVLSWWVARDCGAMPPDLLPPCGMVASDAAGPAAAGFAYFCEGARVAFLDWFVARPGMKPSSTRAHLRSVLAALQGEAARRGVRYCLGSVAAPGMVREAAAVGYFPVEGDFKHFIKDLGP